MLSMLLLGRKCKRKKNTKTSKIIIVKNRKLATQNFLFNMHINFPFGNIKRLSFLWKIRLNMIKYEIQASSALLQSYTNLNQVHLIYHKLVSQFDHCTIAVIVQSLLRDPCIFTLRGRIPSEQFCLVFFCNIMYVSLLILVKVIKMQAIY